MMCTECLDADVDPNRKIFLRGCISCEARALVLAGMTYRDSCSQIMEQVFGDSWVEGAALTRNWAHKIGNVSMGRQK